MQVWILLIGFGVQVALKPYCMQWDGSIGSSDQIELLVDNKIDGLLLLNFDKFMNLDIAWLKNLSELELFMCDNVADLELAKLLNLTSLTITWCDNFSVLDLSNLLNLEQLTLVWCEDLVRVYIPKGLKKLIIYGCNQLSLREEALPLTLNPNYFEVTNNFEVDQVKMRFTRHWSLAHAAKSLGFLSGLRFIFINEFLSHSFLGLKVLPYCQTNKFASE